MSSAKSDPRVAAVVVTYNRLALLQECVAALRAQTRPPDEIIVVNNGSTDGTASWLAAQPWLTVVTQANVGSSGGQATGIRTAYDRGHDWFWCMDDDSIPAPDALAALARAPAFAAPDTGYLSNLVHAPDGRTVPDGYFDPVCGPVWAASVLADRCVRVGQSTFVGLMVSRRAVAAAGLPVRAFFYGLDDVEFTTRIGRRGFKNYCVLDSRVVHKTPGGGAGFSTGKFRHWIRNRIFLVRLGPGSRLGRVARVARLLLADLVMLLRRRYGMRDFSWSLKGAFTPLRVETVA